MCKHIKCKCCQNIAIGKSQIQSNSTKKVFHIKDHLDCGSTNVINGYIKHSASRHAVTHHAWLDFTITPVEQIHKNRNIAKTLSQREMFWIYQLNTLTPYGLNESLDNVFQIIAFFSTYGSCSVLYHLSVTLSISRSRRPRSRPAGSLNMFH